MGGMTRMPEIRFSSVLSVKQKKAIKYLAGTNLSKTDIAERIGISTAALNEWLKKDDFVKVLDRAINLVDQVDLEFRRKQVCKLLPALYEELLNRGAEGDLEEIETKKLVDIISKLQHEQRLDTPGDFTSKSATGNLPDLSDRYQKSLSGTLHKENKLRVAVSKKVVNMEDALDEQ